MHSAKGFKGYDWGGGGGGGGGGKGGTNRSIHTCVVMLCLMRCSKRRASW